jgi:hypothetical protein
MSLVLDSGALIALEKNDRAMWRLLKAELLAKNVPVSHGGVVGQAWRGGGPRQTLFALALAEQASPRGGSRGQSGCQP